MYQGKRRRVHRVLYELMCGTIPPGLYVCHRCDVPCCVNINHLFLGTHHENMSDSKQKGRMASKRGTLNGQARLNEEQVKWIREQRGISISAMAQSLGVSRQTVSAVIHRVNWPHLVSAGVSQ